MSYRENPKTKGSGIVCCIPQTGECLNYCEDCFFQSGRSYLEPLDDNLPNMPGNVKAWQVVRVNDGNDSGHASNVVLGRTQHYPLRFFNTSIPFAVQRKITHDPIVLTVNPGKQTDISWEDVGDIPKNLMFVRFRTNMWNLKLMDGVIEHYSSVEVPIVLTFMAYFEGKIPAGYKRHYTFRKRTLNSYWAITTTAWESVMARHRHNKWVHSCGKIEGELGTTACRHCGNCLREYHATMERLSQS